MEAVDLGLSVKWASCNVGASKPQDFGDHFAWGETNPKTEFYESNYKFYQAGPGQQSDDPWALDWVIRKYCTAATRGPRQETFGKVDGKTELEAEDDAAAVRLGRGWRLPTESERKELLSKCKWSWTTVRGVAGYKVTSPKTGNSIFLPAAGYYMEDNYIRSGTIGFYWTSTLPEGYDPIFASYMGFTEQEIYPSDKSEGAVRRYFGFSIRPVTP